MYLAVNWRNSWSRWLQLIYMCIFSLFKSSHLRNMYVPCNLYFALCEENRGSRFRFLIVANYKFLIVQSKFFKSLFVNNFYSIMAGSRQGSWAKPLSLLFLLDRAPSICYSHWANGVISIGQWGMFHHEKGAIWQSHLAAQKEGVVTTIFYSNHKTY